MKRKNNKSLKIIAATAVTLFSLVTVFSATIAWLAINESVKGKGLQIDVTEYGKKFKQMTFHNFLREENGNYVFSKTASATIGYNFVNNQTTFNGTAVMDGFSLDDPSHPILAIIELKPFNQSAIEADPNATGYETGSGENRVSIAASTKRHWVCERKPQIDPDTGEPVINPDTGEPVLTEDFEEELNNESNPLSSIIKFAPSTYSTTTYASHVNAAETELSFTKPSTWDHFVDITVSSENIDFGGWNPNKTLVDTYDGTQVRYIAIIFDYYEEALSYIYNVYLGDPVLEQETVPFFCDIVFSV